MRRKFLCSWPALGLLWAGPRLISRVVSERYSPLLLDPLPPGLIQNTVRRGVLSLRIQVERGESLRYTVRKGSNLLLSGLICKSLPFELGSPGGRQRGRVLRRGGVWSGAVRRRWSWAPSLVRVSHAYANEIEWKAYGALRMRCALRIDYSMSARTAASGADWAGRTSSWLALGWLPAHAGIAHTTHALTSDACSVAHKLLLWKCGILAPFSVPLLARLSVCLAACLPAWLHAWLHACLLAEDFKLPKFLPPVRFCVAGLGLSLTMMTRSARRTERCGSKI